MTFKELIVYNSTIPEGQGTLLEHLQNIKVQRDAICQVAIAYNEAVLTTDVNGDVLAGNVQHDALVINILDNTVTGTLDDNYTIQIQG